jgi:LAO/AO transport system kinase
MNLEQEVLAGNRLALARLLTQIENGTPAGQAGLDELFLHTGQAHLVGITGATGTGKSSLVNRLVHALRHPQDGSLPSRVGVVAVDPSSPFTGGALLGDRVRMRDLAGDPGVFIRSMASRGSLGGLARATEGLVQVLDAAGYEVIFIETVGAGQAEVEIARLAHTTIVVETPGMGDEIQAIKAGILEIADILVINKADRPGAENTEKILRSMLEMSISNDAVPENQNWIPRLVKTVATQNEGTQVLVDTVKEHARYLKQSGKWHASERARLENELQVILQELLMKRWQSHLPADEFQKMIDRVIQRELSPYRAAASLIEMEEKNMAY